MGTPVGIRSREEQCVGAGKCSEPRPLTEEEMKKYYTESEVKEMSKKIEPVEKEKLVGILGEVSGKTKAVSHAAKVFDVSAPVIYTWIKEYGIEFDDCGKVIRESDKVVGQKEAAEFEESIQGISEVMQGYKPPIIDGKTIVITDPTVLLEKEVIDNHGSITIVGQETKEITKRLGYAEHDVGNATVIYDFRADLVKIVTPNNNEMTPEVARAVAEDLLDILGHE
jgi:hypothetical protein